MAIKVHKVDDRQGRLLAVFEISYNPVVVTWLVMLAVSLSTVISLLTLVWV